MFNLIRAPQVAFDRFAIIKEEDEPPHMITPQEIEFRAPEDKLSRSSEIDGESVELKITSEASISSSSESLSFGIKECKSSSVEVMKKIDGLNFAQANK